MQVPISLAGQNDRGEAGFSLLEIICVVAIFAILASIALPTIPRGTSRARIQSYALAMATLLKADRDTAVRRGSVIATEIDPKTRFIRSGATGRIVRVPDDVKFDALLAKQCQRRAASSSIRFLASGMSCGGVITLTRGGAGFEVRVNWLTGGIDIVPSNQS